MNRKTTTPEELRRLELLQDKKNQDKLKRFILDQTEAKVKDKFSDNELDAENEKRRLLKSLDDYWTIKKVDGQVLKMPAVYDPIFRQEYYIEMYRLNGWKHGKNISTKKWKAGKYTNEIIYFRFSHEVLPFLRIINPYIIPGIRRYKHHQYLTPGARIELQRFIDEAVDMMRECSDWNEFRIKYCTKYNVPYQLRLF